jgi:hypothetical protein
MNQLRDYKPVADHVEAALEDACAVLMTLESICAGAGGVASELTSFQSRIREAVESLRYAIAELRLARAEPPTPISLGFVLGDGSPVPADRPDADDQPRPRRTA